MYIDQFLSSWLNVHSFRTSRTQVKMKGSINIAREHDKSHSYSASSHQTQNHREGSLSHFVRSNLIRLKKRGGYDQTAYWGNNNLSIHQSLTRLFCLKSNFRRALIPLWSSSYGGELAKVATFCNKVIFLFPSCIWWTSQWIVINVDGFGRKYLLDEPGAKFRPLPGFDGIWWWWW